MCSLLRDKCYKSTKQDYAQLRLAKLEKPKERQRKIWEKHGATYFTLVYKKQFITNGAL
jgi:hypothetical protein